MKTSNRIKLSNAPALKTREDMERQISHIRDTTIQRNQLVAELEEQRKALDDEYGPDIAMLAQRLKEQTEELRQWAQANPDEFAGRKSLDTIHGRLGWRMGQWQCDKLPGWIWARTKKSAKAARVILDKIKSLPAMRDYIRTKEEVDKDAIIADRGVLTADALCTIGVRVFQEESFFVEPKLDEVENRQTA